MDAWIFDAVRTPRGAARPDGALAGVRPVELVAQLLHALEARGLDPAAVDDVLLGCNTQVNDQGANIAKTAALWAGWPATVAGATLNSFCTSGLDAVAAAAARVATGTADLVVAGGVESMSRVPILGDGGAWFSDQEVAERTGFVHMGVAADVVATLHRITREDCDAYAVRSQHRAAAATAAGHFDRSMVAVHDPGDPGRVLLDRDEAIRPGVDLQKLASMPAAFAEIGPAMGHDERAVDRIEGLDHVEHVHTVATSPAMVDAASAVVVARAEVGERLGLEPRARIVAAATVGVDPVVMLTGPEVSTRKALGRAGLALDDIDLWEMNESFAAPVLHFQRSLGIDDSCLNVDGGAIAMGHPLGATGGILLATLLDALARTGGSTGAVTIPAGAGLATTLVVSAMG